MKTKILITGACGVTSRAIARSLRMSKCFGDVELIGTDICANPYGLYEGLFDKIYRVPHVNSSEYNYHMTHICGKELFDGAIVIPELEVLYWSDKIFPCRVLLPPPKFCRIVVSKKRLYDALQATGLVPSYLITEGAELLDGNLRNRLTYPCWIRDYSEGASSGKGALLARDEKEIHAWVELNRAIPNFMIAEYLPGRNFACHLLYHRGTIVKVASYERLEYFMARTVMSGISGNICRGRLINDSRLEDISARAVTHVVQGTEETMSGIVAADLRESGDGTPLITEINLRHVACTYSFAAAGFNLAEAQLLLTLGRSDECGPREMFFPERNSILRDIDGMPIWIKEFRELGIGEMWPQSGSNS
jgi:hypothetical protein